MGWIKLWHGGPQRIPTFEYNVGEDWWESTDETTQEQLRNMLLNRAEEPVQIQLDYGGGWCDEIQIFEICPDDSIVGAQKNTKSGTTRPIRIILRPRADPQWCRPDRA